MHRNLIKIRHSLYYPGMIRCVQPAALHALEFSKYKACCPRAHTTTAASSAAPSSSTSDKTGAIVQGSSEAWNSEPRTLDDLEARYDTLHTFPGRNANTVLKIVPASEKGQETAKLVCDGQQHKLFMVSGSEIPHSASRVSSKVCCVLNGSDLATTTLT